MSPCSHRESLSLAEAEPDGPGLEAHVFCFSHTTCDYSGPGRKNQLTQKSLRQDSSRFSLSSYEFFKVAAVRPYSFWGSLKSRLG